MTSRATSRVQVLRFGPEGASARADLVAAEEPLEIRLTWAEPVGGTAVTRPVAVTMRTPGHDVELAVGFLFAEGILRTLSDLRQVAHCAGGGPQNFNVVEVRLAPGVRVDTSLLDRNFPVSSSCGVCGKASLDGVAARRNFAGGEGPRLTADLVRALPERLRSAQALFDRTGGLHGAGLFDAEGERVTCREDVGRHNAVDKVVGRALLDGTLPLDASVLVVSGRTSFEILQKALAAGISFVVGVGAPSSLAVALARRFELTLVGFTGPDGFNVYAGERRLS